MSRHSKAGRISYIYLRDDGGRKATGLAGFQKGARDCVARSIAIASGLPYKAAWDTVAAYNVTLGKKRSADHGVETGGTKRGIDAAWVALMAGLGFRWVPTPKARLRIDQLPMGRLIVAHSRHYIAVIDRMPRDTSPFIKSNSRRVIDGYFIFEG